MTQPVRWGILGTGNIAHKFADAVAAEDSSVLQAVASRTPGKAEAFAASHGLAAQGGAHGKYEALLRRDDIDAVYIATTHNQHHDVARLALAYDKPLLVEKPLTVNADEARDLIAEAGRRGVFLMEAMWTRFVPVWRALRDQVQHGGVGRVRHLSATFGGFAPPHYAPRLKDPARAGGVTLDMGVYPISLVCYLLGEVPRIQHSRVRFSDEGVDEQASYLFEFPGGATASITTSFTLKMPQTFQVYGETAWVDFPEFQRGTEFTRYRHDGTNDVVEREPHQFVQHDNGFIYQVAEVVRCLRASELQSPLMPWAESEAILSIMDRFRADWGLTYPFEERR